MRLVDADGFIGKFDMSPLVQEALRKALNHMPTVDAEPVGHGHWIESKGGDYIGYPVYECSSCGCPVGEEASNYCPYCGAKMDEVGK